MNKNTIFSPAELKVYEMIKHRVTRGISGAKNPVTIVLGGQPGAGKSGIYNLARERFNGNIVELDCDKFREFHPDAKELAKNPDTYGEKTNPFVSAVVDCVAEELSELGYNMIIESPMKLTNTAFWLHEMLTPKGYSVEAHVMATPKEVSWSGVISRYEEQLANGELARIVPKEFHDYVTEHITDALSEIYKSGKMSNIIVMDRAKTIMYDMSKTPEKNPSSLIDNIINKGYISRTILSQDGHDKLNAMPEDAASYSKFLKMYGKLFKFPTSVAIEYFSRSNDTECIATEKQWNNLGYTLKTNATAVEYIDANDNVHSFYDFSQLKNAEQLPDRWAVTQENADAVKEYLRSNYNIYDDNPNASILSMMLYCTNVFYDAHRCMEQLEKEEAIKLDETEKAEFFKCYVNNFSLIVAGRLEINASRPFNITPDMTIINKLEYNSQRLTYLSYVGKTAKDALRIVEQAVNVYDEKRREVNNELRSMEEEEEENRSQGTSSSVGISNRSSERSSPSESDRNDDILRLGGRTSESEVQERESDRHRGGHNSVLENDEKSEEQSNRVRVRTESGELHLRSGEEELRAVNGGRTDRNLWSEVVGYDAESLRNRTGNSDELSAASERSEGSGENGENLSGNTGETVRGEQPTSDRQLRSDSSLVEEETVRSGQYGDERSSASSIYEGHSVIIDNKESEEESSNDSFSFADEAYIETAVHNAFVEFNLNHTAFTEKQKTFFERLEKFAVNNAATENLIDRAFAERPAYRRAYGNRELLSRNTFEHKLTAYENELQGIISRNLAENNEKTADSVEQEDLKRTEIRSEKTEGQEMAISFDIPSIDTSLRNDFQSGKLSFNEVAAELHAANLISHIDDYERVAEILGTESIVSQLDATLDKYYINADTERVTQVSYNPDSSEGGQLVYTDIDFDTLREALESDNPMDYIYSNGETSFTDITNEQFIYDAAKFLTDKADFTNKDNSVIDELGKLAKSEKNQNIVVDIPKYNLTLDFSEIKSVSLKEGQQTYIGGLDSNGHEAKDNYDIETKTNRYYAHDTELYVHNSEYGTVPTTIDTMIEDIEQFLDKSLNSTDYRLEIEDKNDNVTIFNATLSDSILLSSKSYYRHGDVKDIPYTITIDGEIASIKLSDEVTTVLMNRFDNGFDDDKSIYLDTDFQNWNRFVIRDNDGNQISSINTTDLLSIEETATLYKFINEIEYGLDEYIAFVQSAIYHSPTRTAEDITIGDRYNYLNVEYSVVGKKSDEVIISPVEDTTITTSIDRETLHYNGEFLGNASPVKIVTLDVNKVGSFYELYGNDAIIATDILDLHLSLKDGKHMVGFADYLKDEYFEKLQNAGYSIQDNSEPHLSNDKNSEEQNSNLPKRKTTANKLYNLFTEQFPDIANGSHTHERYGKKYDENGENSAYEPLSVEYLGDNQYSFMYWYVQNGDLMRDPDFTFELNHKTKELIIHEYQLDTGSLGTVYYDVFENGEADKKLLGSLNANFLQILKNNAEQQKTNERPLYEYTTKDGEIVVKIEDESDINDHYIENEVISDDEILDNAILEDKSAEWREALNEYSKKHNLGELNLIPPDTASSSWQIRERMVNNTEITLIKFNQYLYPTFSNDTLSKALEQYDNGNAEPINEHYTRKSVLYTYGNQVTPLPEAKKLPDIEYAEKPSILINDNISALRELKRLDERKNENKPLYRNENDEFPDYTISTKQQSDAILRRYYGWGGLSQVFDERFGVHERQRNEIKELIGEQDYAKARRSTLNAFYTPQIIIDAMYKAVINMDMPSDARILEPSCGTGNFITRLPNRLKNAEITGVEIDAATAKIASYLSNDNENVKILNMAYEKTDFDNDSFDLVIGNVPFGENKMIDADYDKDLLIHDAFFRKSLDKVKKGGIVAFITTSGTLDKKNSKIREMLAEKADLVGAIRLPNNAFGGTGVTSDIIFLQKRENPLQPFEKKPEWCYTTLNEDGLRINSYFVDNPQMMLGKMEKTSFYDRLTCTPIENADLSEQLDEAIKNINAKVRLDKREKLISRLTNKVEPWGKNFSYHLKDDKVYYRINGNMKEVTFSGTKKLADKNAAMLKALIELRTATRDLINRQSENVEDEALVPYRSNLNNLYDKFVKEHGEYLSSAKVKKLFADDSDYSLLEGLEEKKEVNKNGETAIEITKAPIFFKRTVNAVIEITAVENEEEALQVSLDKKGEVDIIYMSTLLSSKYPDNSIDEIADKIIDNLVEKGMIFDDPSKAIMDKPYSGLVDRAEYLSGNVRQKLVFAEEAHQLNPQKYKNNIEALQTVIPTDIPAEEISIRMGVTWVDDTDYTAFLHELSGRSETNRSYHKVHFLPGSCSFDIEGARVKTGHNIQEEKVYGISKEYNMYRIAESLLNQRSIKVYDKKEDGGRILNHEATKAANKCAEKIDNKFQEWIFKDEARKEKYVRKYNDIFNSIVGRSYDGSKLSFNGINNGFELRPHQKNCVARAVFGGNTLAAHVVGAGKSAVMFSTIMKKKQLGLINKACVVVPKALVEQTADEWRKWYPDAKLLTISASDLSNEKNRLLFASKVATGDYDGVIMAQQQFDKIGMKPEYIEEFKQRQIDALEDMKNKELYHSNGVKTPSVKELEKLIEKYEKELEALYTIRSKARGKDNLLYFEDLGFDYLVVDEAHAYKNGHFFTKMENVSGVSSSSTGRSADMYLKTDYFNETFGNGHIFFATGTPVTNSMTELYVMTRYLRPDLLKQSNTEFFDSWASTFGKIVARDDTGLDGKLQVKTSFSKFTNLPELMATYKEFADIQSQEKLNLPRPELKSGKVQIVSVDASPEQKRYIQEIAERAKAIQNGNPIPRANGKEDCYPVLTNEAKILGLGNRVIKTLYEKQNIPLPEDFVEDEYSKVDKCIDNVVEIYNRENSKGNSKAVQIIFSDVAVNSDNGNFSAYEYIKQQLAKKGIPENEIVFGPKSDAKDRADIFKKINEGTYRVVIASTQTLGTGANIQQNMYALHHLDIPWKPSDFEQREGRILRQGNVNKEVEIFNYVTKGTFDSFLYQTVLNKAKFISQILDNDIPARVCEDADEKVLSFGEILAVAEGNPLFKELATKKNELAELKLLYNRYQGETIDMKKSLPRLEENLQNSNKLLGLLEADKRDAPKEFSIKDNNGKVYTDKKEINEFLNHVVKNKWENDDYNATFFVGDFKVEYNLPKYFDAPATFTVSNSVTYTIELKSTPDLERIDTTLSTRLNNLFENGIDKRIADTTNRIEELKMNIQQSNERINTPFEHLDTLTTLEKDVEALTDKIYSEQSEDIKPEAETRLNEASNSMTM